MINDFSSIKGFSAPLVASSPVVQLEHCRAFLVRVADVEAAYRKLLRSSMDVGELSDSADRFQSALYRACEAFCNGQSQAVRQVYRLPLH